MMSDRTTTTLALALAHPATTNEDSALIKSLLALSAKSPKLVKASEYDAPAVSGVKVRSWKMNEFKYYDVPSPFPTLARGLFTVEVSGDEEGKGVNAQRIVVRGYDKFFNIGEVPWTTWTSLSRNTSAPYTLSLKSNGCIIFIGALTPEKLLFTSKHSLGPVGNAQKSHAQAGEEWMRKYLEEKGKTEKDLAKTLWDNNWTAVAELCDDSFEEHVLAYPPSLTGLHLHGLNTCTKAFHTLPHEVIDAFADEWGFIKTKSKTLNSIEEVKEFAERIGKEQVWEGQAVEGFVVRTTVCSPPKSTSTDEEGPTKKSSSSSSSSSSLTPYPPGSTFFFKIKFDEPYMMYRDWREVTKTLLSSRSKGGSLSEKSVPKSKLKRPETRVYVRWVIREIQENPKEFEGYSKGKGIIATRERFLRWLEGTEGQKEREVEAVEAGGAAEGKEGKKEAKEVKGKEFDKTIIVPVAIPGCGKTSVAVALQHIFGFGHTQSDDVKIKKAAPVFLRKVAHLLKSNDVVIADKNNHLRQHRRALRDLDLARLHELPKPPRVRLLALDWSRSITLNPPSTAHRICTDRVLSRGTNHQSLLADTSPARAHEDVVWMFINGMEELREGEVDECIEMELEEGLEDAVERAVKGVCRVLGVERPGEEKIKEGVEKAKEYRVVVKEKMKEKDKTKEQAPTRYFGILAEVDFESVLTPVLGGDGDGDAELGAFWKYLKLNNRVTKKPHVTIVHRKSREEESELWERCEGLHASTNPPIFEMRLGEVLWDERVMAICVELVGVVSGSGSGSEADHEEKDKDQLGAEFVSKLPEEVRERLHITVGTRNYKVKPVEAKGLVERWRDGEREGVKSAKVEGVVVVGRVKGLVN